MRTEYERVSPESVGIPSAAVLEMVDALEKAAEMHGFMVLRHGRVCAEGWWSPYGPGIPHGPQSLTKTYTATAVGLAYTEGLLRLDEKLADLFPGYLPDEAGGHLKKRTIYDVLTMGNGMERCTLGEADWIRSCFAEPAVHEPGTSFFCGSTGSGVLGAVVRLKTGKSLHGWLSEKLFAKIGINAKNIRWVRTQDGMEVDSGGMLATAEDNLRLMDLYLRGGVWEGERLLAEDFVRMAAANQLPGCGFQTRMCRPEGAYWACGAFGQYAVVFPEQDMIISLTGTGAADGGGPRSPLDAVCNTILPALSDVPLPEDPEALAALRRRTGHLAIERPPYRPYSPLAEQLDGAVWKIPDGAVHLTPYPVDHLSKKRLTSGIQEFSFRFGVNRAQMEYLEDGTRRLVEIAMDGTRMLNVLPNSGTPFHKVYLSAYWARENVLRLACRWIESAYEHTLDFRFDDPTAAITFHDPVCPREPAGPAPVLAVRL